MLEHLPEVQLSEQQSVAAAQAAPALAHVVTAEIQPVFGSQLPEQQSLPAWQAKPTAWHVEVSPAELELVPAVAALPPVDEPAVLVEPPAAPLVLLLLPQPDQNALATRAMKVTVFAKRIAGSSWAKLAE